MADPSSLKHDWKDQRLKNLRFKENAKRKAGKKYPKSSANVAKSELGNRLSDESNSEYDGEDMNEDDDLYLSVLKNSKGADYALLLEEKAIGIFSNPPQILDMELELQHDWTSFTNASEPSDIDVLSIDLEKLGKSIAIFLDRKDLMDDFALRAKVDSSLSKLEREEDDTIYDELLPYTRPQHQQWNDAKTKSPNPTEQSSVPFDRPSESTISQSLSTEVESSVEPNYEQYPSQDEHVKPTEPKELDGESRNVMTAAIPPISEAIPVASEQTKEMSFSLNEFNVDESPVTDILASGSLQGKKEETSIDDLLDLLDVQSTPNGAEEGLALLKPERYPLDQVGNHKTETTFPAAPSSQSDEKSAQGLIQSAKKDLYKKRVPSFSVDDILDMIDTVQNEKGVESDKHGSVGISDILEKEMKLPKESPKDVKPKEDDFDAWFQSIQ